MARLLHWYPSFTRTYVLYELPMCQGWAFYAATIEQDGWMQFNNVRAQSTRYVGAEVKAMVKTEMEKA